MEKISLSLNLVNQIMGYLGSRPYQEVFQLVNAMQDEAKQAVAPKIEQPVEPTES
jgi:hypothetical protein